MWHSLVGWPVPGARLHTSGRTAVGANIFHLCTLCMRVCSHQNGHQKCHIVRHQIRWAEWEASALIPSLNGPEECSTWPQPAVAGQQLVHCFTSHASHSAGRWTLHHLRTRLSCQWRIKAVSYIGIKWKGDNCVFVRGSVVNGDFLGLPEFKK